MVLKAIKNLIKDIYYKTSQVWNRIVCKPIKDFLLKLRSLKYFFELVWYFPRTRSESIFESILIRNWEIMLNRKMKNRKYDATNYDMSWNPGSVFTELPFETQAIIEAAYFGILEIEKRTKQADPLKIRSLNANNWTRGRFWPSSIKMKVFLPTNRFDETT